MFFNEPIITIQVSNVSSSYVFFFFNFAVSTIFSMKCNDYYPAAIQKLYKAFYFSFFFIFHFPHFNTLHNPTIIVQ